jgi:hypothetical protein
MSLVFSVDVGVAAYEGDLRAVDDGAGRAA